MKKLSLVFLVLFGVSKLFAQMTWEDISKAKEKSDKEITDEKKKTKAKTWVNRGEVYLEMAQVNTRGLYAGMTQTGFTGAEVLVGKPSKKETKEDGSEVWVYERVNLIFRDGLLDSWDETQPMDAKALDKSYEAFFEAFKLEEKLKTKKTVGEKMIILRSLFVQRGITHYGKKEYNEALHYLEGSVEINQVPTVKTDITYDEKQIVYYCGVVSELAKNYEKAKKYYQKAINNGTEGGKSYIYLSNVQKATGDSATALQTLKTGFEKYPSDQNVLIELINFYLVKNEMNLALDYLNKAIERDRSNPQYYFAQGTLYDRMSTDKTLKATDAQKEEYKNKAISAYEQAIKLDDKMFNAYYNLGALYYNNAAKVIEMAQNIPPKETAKYDAEMAKAEGEFKKSLPYMEKASQLNDKDMSTLQTLETVYKKLKMYDKAKIVKAKIEELQTAPQNTDPMKKN